MCRAPLALGVLLLAVSSIFAGDPGWHLMRPSNTGIPGEEVEVVRFAPDGRIWVGARWPFWHQGGVGILDPQHDVWETHYNGDTGSGPGPIPSEFVNDIAFAANGTAWIATDGGLVKHEGDLWTLFDSHNTPMAFDVVASVSVAPNGHIWINNSSFNAAGDAIWDFDGTTWTDHRVGRDLPWAEPWQDLNSVYAAANGDVWVTNAVLAGAARFHAGSWTLHGGSIGGFDEIVEDPAGNVWFAPGLGQAMLGKWNGAQFKGISVGLDVMTVATDTDGAVYYGNWAGQVKRSYDGGVTWQTFLSGLAYVFNVAPDPHGDDVWVGTIGALGHFTGTGQWLEDYNSYTTGMPDFFLSDLHRGQKSGHMFIASMEVGITRFDGVRWENRGSHNPNIDWPVLADGADAVYEDRQGLIWIGTNGVARWNPASDGFDLWDWRNAPWGVTDFTDFAEDAAGRLFAFEKYGSVYRFNPATSKWTKEPVSVYATLGIAGAEADRHGNIFLGGWFDIAKWDGASWSFLPLPYPDYLYDLGGASRLALGLDDSLWIGCPRGLVHYDGVTWQLYTQQNSPLAGDAISGIAFRQDGVMAVSYSDWADMTNAGVAVIDGDFANPQSWSLYRWGQTPLPHYAVDKLAFDARGDLWISCMSEAAAVLEIGRPTRPHGTATMRKLR